MFQVLTLENIATVLPGRLFKPAFEDAGTMTSSLVPWNSCGAYMSATLGIATLTYGPWAILNWVNPIVACVFAYTGIKIFYTKDGY